MEKKIKKGIRLIIIGFLLIFLAGTLALVTLNLEVKDQAPPVPEEPEPLSDSGTLMMIASMSVIMGLLTSFFGFLTAYIGYKERKMELENKNVG